MGVRWIFAVASAGATLLVGLVGLGCAGVGNAWRCEAQASLATDLARCGPGWSSTARGIGADVLRGSSEGEAVDRCEALVASLLRDAPSGCYTGVTSPCALTGCATFRPSVPWH